jgi:threonine/homoserine/homoserine lactone efflux protein
VDFRVILIGTAIGLAAAAPLGPINFMVIRNVLRSGLGGGLAAALGSVIGDGMLASIAAFGIRATETFVHEHALVLQSFGGLLMVTIGFRTALTKLDASAIGVTGESVSGVAAARQTATTLALTLTNPATLTGMLAMFAGVSPVLKLGGAPDRATAAMIGVMLGSFAWWLLIGGLTVMLRTRLSAGILEKINRWSGVLIAGFGIALLLGAAGL